MVKLLRITSQDNGIFKADLDAGIDIKENSSIALQNLTFETQDFTAFRVGAVNRIVKFDYGNLQRDLALTANLKVENYTKATIQTFYKNLEATLNRCLGVGSSAASIGNQKGDSYANFMIRYDTENIFPPPSVPVEENSIIYKLSPMLLMFNFNDTGDPRGSDGMELFDRSRNSANTPALTIKLSGTSQELGDMRQIGTAAATNEFINYIYPQIYVEWCKGSSMFMVGIASLVANAGAADTNGFSIGLSFTNIGFSTDLGNKPIPTSARDFEIRVKRPTDFFEFVEPSNPGVNQVSTYTPFLVTDPDALKNDHLLFERREGKILASVINGSSAGGVKNFIFEHTLTDDEMEKSIYPYISVFGAAGEVLVGRPIVTINPFFYPVTNNIQALDNQYYQHTGLNQSILGGPNAYDSLTDFSAVVPYSDDLIFEDERTAKNNYNPKLTINAEVLRVIGFNKSGNSPVTLQRPETLLTIDENQGLPFLQFNIVSEGLNNFVNSDNYIVLLDSNPLYSYDASQFDYADKKNTGFDKYNKRGRRLNILATIPINNNTGIMEYQPNELVYIDFDNKFPQILKNIRLRVLDKDFNQIKTAGESIMTLLIKDN
jgi:hypothetical protein